MATLDACVRAAFAAPGEARASLRAEMAAAQRARTTTPIEQFALLLHEPGEQANDALSAFLTRQLDGIDESCQAQLMLLCTWLMQLYLERGSLGERAHEQTRAAEFAKFLADHGERLHHATTCRQLAAHGTMSELLRYAALRKDWQRLVALHLQQLDVKAALQVVTELVAATAKQPTPDWSLVRLIETHSAEFVRCDQAATIGLWHRVVGLDPMQLVPAILSCGDDEAGREAKRNGIRYFSSLSGQEEDSPALHNALALLHAQSSSDAELHEFLASDLLYERDYALAVCRESARHDACILLLQRAGSLAEASNYAAQHGLPDTARRIVEQGPMDDVLRRRLTLQLLGPPVRQRLGAISADEIAVHTALDVDAEPAPTTASHPTLSLHDCMRMLAEDSGIAQSDGSALLRLEDVLPLLDEYIVVRSAPNETPDDCVSN